MAKRARTNRRRAPNKRRRMARPARFLRPRGRPQVVHSFRRMIAAPGQLTGNAAYSPYLANFGLNGISNVVSASDFTSLFDQYKINYCVWKAYLKIDPSAQAATTASYPRLFYYRDYDDSSIAGSLDEIRESQRARTVVMNPNRPVVVKFKPNTLATFYNSVGVNNYSPRWGTWLDIGGSGTFHYGFKWAIDDLTNTNYRVNFEITLYFSCKNTR